MTTDELLEAQKMVKEANELGEAIVCLKQYDLNFGLPHCGEDSTRTFYANTAEIRQGMRKQMLDYVTRCLETYIDEIKQKYDVDYRTSREYLFVIDVLCEKAKTPLQQYFEREGMQYD